MKLNQFAVYRVNKNSEGRKLWHLSYQEAVSRKLPIRIEFYKQMIVGKLKDREIANDLWKRMKEQCEISDVLVINQGGEISCYYMNEDYPQRLVGFIRLNPSGTLITLDTENFRIDGKAGNWMATDDIIIEGKQFYLMEHQEIRMEHYQKFFENGTYERSWESGTEANYDMVDGRVNNQKRKPEKMAVEKTKKRQSVIKRLREKQIAIAVKSGKPVPRYLNQQMERKV